MSDTVPAMVLVRIVFAPPVAWIRVVPAFPGMVATVEPFPDPLIRCVRMAVEIERVEQIRAACDEVLVGVFVVPALAEQVFHESRRIRATADLRNHASHDSTYKSWWRCTVSTKEFVGEAGV